MSKNIQTIGINFRDGNGSGGNFGGGSSYQHEERKEAVQTTVPYNPPTFLGNKDMVQPYQSNLGAGSMFGSSGGGYVGVAEYHSITSNPHVGIGVHNWIPPELEQIQSIQTVTTITQPVVTSDSIIVKPVLTQKEIQAKADAWAKPFIEAKKSNIKAKAIVQKIVDVQMTEDKVLDLSNIPLTYTDMRELMSEVRYVNFDLDAISLENTKLDSSGFGAFIRILTVKDKGIFHNVVHLNLSNNNVANQLTQEISRAFVRDQLPNTKTVNLSGNNITDSGVYPITEALKTGKMNNLQKLDISGNKITEAGDGYLVEAIQGAKVRGGIIIVTHKVEWAETGPMAQFAKNIRGPFNETVDALIDGAKKQGTLAFGTKEAKQAIIGGWLESAQSKGVDTKNVVVSKDIFEAVINSGKLFGNFHLGWAKCSVVPKDVKSFAADKILAIASPEAGVIKTGIDIAFCYFESCDEAMSSQHGVQFLGDLGLLPQGEFIDAIE